MNKNRFKNSSKSYKCSSKKTLKIVNKLEKYWANELPLLDNKKTWFFKISKEFEMTLDAIIKIELKHRPRYFKPTKNYP
tara:strand:+ start:370 stop:606 length:237 start_codon:yes stop_codon:yes gene_type:complete